MTASFGKESIDQDPSLGHQLFMYDVSYHKGGSMKMNCSSRTQDRRLFQCASTRLIEPKVNDKPFKRQKCAVAKSWSQSPVDNVWFIRIQEILSLRGWYQCDLWLKSFQ